MQPPYICSICHEEWGQNLECDCACTRKREALSKRPTHMIPHLYPDMIFCAVCSTPVEGCECKNPGECAVCGEAAELIGEVCAECAVLREEGEERPKTP